MINSAVIGSARNFTIVLLNTGRQAYVKLTGACGTFDNTFDDTFGGDCGNTPVPNEGVFDYSFDNSFRIPGLPVVRIFDSTFETKFN
jgi:hypothetical protein